MSSRIQRLVSNTIAFTTLTAMLALLAPVRAEAIIVDFKFGQVGVVFDAGQAVQVNASHIGDPHIAPAPCTVVVEFIDGMTAALLKMATFKLAAGETRSAEIGFIDVLLKGKIPIYARVTVDDPNEKPTCRPSLEAFDTGTGRTAVAIGDPHIRLRSGASFSALSLVSGQILRLDAVNMGDPEQAPCPILLTIFGPDGTVLGQARPTLASGAGTALDVVIGDPNVRVPLRATASRAVKDGREEQNLCRAFVFSVEVHDAATGIATLLQSPPDDQ